MKRQCILVLVFILAASKSSAAEKRAVSKPPAAEQNAYVAMKEAANGELIDINSASEKQLNAIKGIGEEYSERIIAGRPYYNQEQLVSRKIIPRDIYETVKDQIIAKQAF